MKKYLWVARKTVWAGLLLLILVIGGFMGGYFYIEEELPQLPKNLSYINYRPPTEIYSSDGEVIKILGLKSTVRLDMISWKFQKAILATEDSRFFQHHGIDPTAFLRAIFVNFKKLSLLMNILFMNDGPVVK